VLNELDSTVTACRFDRTHGNLEPFQILSSLPDAFVGNSRASEIEVSPDGRFVYASNRGYDSIAFFAIDAGTGRMTSLVGKKAKARHRASLPSILPIVSCSWRMKRATLS